jgi:hypothetical protein
MSMQPPERAPEQTDQLERIRIIVNGLADPLRAAISERIYFPGGREHTLRNPICALVTEVLSQELTDQGLPADSMQVRLPTDYHELAICCGQDDPVLIDGSYGQFLQPFGCTPEFAVRTGDEATFPTTQIAVFRSSETAHFSRRLADHVMAFHDRHAGDSDLTPYRQYLKDINCDEIEFLTLYFSSVWDISKYRPIAPIANDIDVPRVRQRLAEFRAGEWIPELSGSGTQAAA